MPSWPPERVAAGKDGGRLGGIGVRGHVGANHRMLPTYLNIVIRAGFVLDQFEEHGDSLPAYFLLRAHLDS